MWFREFGEVFDVLPYYLLICLPVFIALSPINPVESASELDVHRLAQYELSGILHGSKHASLTMDARGPKAAQVLRKTVVAKMSDLSVGGFRELISNGVGGLLLLVKPGLAGVTPSEREAILQLEEELLNGELDIPVYFAEETPELLELHATLRDEGESGEAAGSAASALLNSISNSGYQLVVSASNPAPVKEQVVMSASGILPGSGGDDQIPTVVVVAHYDAGGSAPSLAQGADTNGSGVSILLEMARIFSALYQGSRTHPAYSLVFLLSGGGKLNYAGTKRWLDEHLDLDAASDVLSKVKYVLCLDSLGKDGSLKLHVSKPPKEGSDAAIFFSNLHTVSQTLYPAVKAPEIIHKKINLADDLFSWEHERFSIRRLPAMTLSHLASPKGNDRQTILDTSASISSEALQRNTRIIAEALACSLYPKMEAGRCTGELFAGTWEPKESSLQGWMDLVTSYPRHATLISDRNSELVKSLTSALARYVQDVSTVTGNPDKREPEFVLYDTPSAVMNIYRVKPAVFDLLLSLVICSYLAVIYLILQNSNTILTVLSSIVRERKVEDSNGHAKMNGKMNGHSKQHAY
jgi:hypothetical protein